MICTTNCTLTTARIDAKSKFNTIFFKKGIENAEICSIIVVWGITTMNNYEFLEKIGFSSNEDVYKRQEYEERFSAQGNPICKYIISR